MPEYACCDVDYRTAVSGINSDFVLTDGSFSALASRKSVIVPASLFHQRNRISRLLWAVPRAPLAAGVCRPVRSVPPLVPGPCPVGVSPTPAFPHTRPPNCALSLRVSPFSDYWPVRLAPPLVPRPSPERSDAFPASCLLPLPECILP